MRAGGVFIEMPRSPAFADDDANRRLAATPADTTMTARAGIGLGSASGVTGATAVSPAQARISEASGTDIGDEQSVSGSSSSIPAGTVSNALRDTGRGGLLHPDAALNAKGRGSGLAGSGATALDGRGSASFVGGHPAADSSGGRSLSSPGGGFRNQ